VFSLFNSISSWMDDVICGLDVKVMMMIIKVKRLKVCIAFHGNPSQSHGAIWDHTVLPAI